MRTCVRMCVYASMQVLLVGGFAQSPYLQSRVRAALADTGLAKELVVPPTPYAAVLQGKHVLGPCLLATRMKRQSIQTHVCVQPSPIRQTSNELHMSCVYVCVCVWMRVCAGAVLYGCDPTLIHARRSRMAYGVKTCTAWQDGAPLHSKFMHKEDQTPYSNARFVPFVRKGELVSYVCMVCVHVWLHPYVCTPAIHCCKHLHAMSYCAQVAHDQAVSRTFHPLYQNQTTTTMLIWATDDNDAK